MASPRPKPVVMSQGQFDTIVDRLCSADAGQVIQVRELLSEVLTQIGGAKQLAVYYSQVLSDPQAASMAKQKVLADLTYMMRYVEQQEGLVGDLGKVDDAELKAVVLDLFREYGYAPSPPGT